MTLKSVKETIDIINGIGVYPIRFGKEKMVSFYTETDKPTTGYAFRITLPYETTGVGCSVTEHLSYPQIKSMTDEEFVKWIFKFKHLILKTYKVVI